MNAIKFLSCVQKTANTNYSPLCICLWLCDFMFQVCRPDRAMISSCVMCYVACCVSMIIFSLKTFSQLAVADKHVMALILFLPVNFYFFCSVLQSAFTQSINWLMISFYNGVSWLRQYWICWPFTNFTTFTNQISSTNNSVRWFTEVGTHDR